MKINKRKIVVFAALILSVLIWTISGCGSHPAYKLKSGESSKIRVIEKGGKLVTLAVKQDGVTEIDSTSINGESDKSKPENEAASTDKKEAENEILQDDGNKPKEAQPEIKNKPDNKTKLEKKNKSDKDKIKNSKIQKEKSDKNDITGIEEKGKITNDKKSKPQKGKKKVWVPAVYKVVNHPAVKKQKLSVHWVCQCGEIFYSDEDWQAHRPKP